MLFRAFRAADEFHLILLDARVAALEVHDVAVVDGLVLGVCILIMLVLIVFVVLPGFEDGALVKVKVGHHLIAKSASQHISQQVDILHILLQRLQLLYLLMLVLEVEWNQLIVAERILFLLLLLNLPAFSCLLLHEGLALDFEVCDLIGVISKLILISIKIEIQRIVFNSLLLYQIIVLLLIFEIHRKHVVEVFSLIEDLEVIEVAESIVEHL